MSKKKSILFIVNSLGTGGAEKHVVTLLNRLDPSKFSLSLAYLKNRTDLLPQLVQSRLDEVVCCEASKGLDWQAVKKLARLVRRIRPETIVCTNQYSMLYGYLAKVLSGQPSKLIDVFHTDDHGGNDTLLRTNLYRYIFSRCDHVVFVCRKQQDYWIKNKKMRLKGFSYIHNGIDVEYFRDQYRQEEKETLRKTLGFSEKDYIVGICAALRPEKNHLGFMKSLEELKESRVSVKALFIGDGPMRTEIEQYITEHGWAGDVAISGFQQDVRPFMAICNAIALPSTSETFSIAALEAMAMGLPLLCADTGGASEQVTSGVNGYLHQKGNGRELSEHISILQDPALRREMGCKARDIVSEKFRLSQMVSAYESLLLAE